MLQNVMFFSEEIGFSFGISCQVFCIAGWPQNSHFVLQILPLTEFYYLKMCNTNAENS